MVAFPTYALGTVSIAAAGTTLIGDGTIWSGVNARSGDTIYVDGVQNKISDVTDETHLELVLPAASALSGVSYVILQDSPLRFVGGQAMADVSSLIKVLNDKGLLWYLPAGYTDPDGNPPALPALTADDGQGILRIDTGDVWVMQGGAWVHAISPDGHLWSVNNLSDLADKNAALTNLGGTTIGKALFAASDSAIARTLISAVGRVKLTRITSSGTYSPDPNLLFGLAECQGAGGGGAGVLGTSSQMGSGGGGGAGGYSAKWFTAADVSGGKAVTIGAGGVYGDFGDNAGGAGGSSLVADICSANGGGGGGVQNLGGSAPGGAGGGLTGAVGDITMVGQDGETSVGSTGGFYLLLAPGARGGHSQFGIGGAPARATIGALSNGNSGTGYGSGGGGACYNNNAGGSYGGSGAPGLVVITEFCSQ